MSGINSDQQIDLLFKQFNVVANTEQAPTSFANQPFLFRDNILNQQILAQEVPSTLPSGFSINELDICGNIAIDSSLNLSVIGYPQLTFYKKLELQQAGNNSAWWHIDGAGKNLLQDTIPFKFDESSADSYNSQLFYELSPGSYAAIGRDEAGTKYLMDTKTGIIEFYEDPATLNTIINASFPPRLSFIAYTGTKGITGGGGGGGDASFNNLSVNNLDVSNNLIVRNTQFLQTIGPELLTINTIKFFRIAQINMSDQLPANSGPTVCSGRFMIKTEDVPSTCIEFIAGFYSDKFTLNDPSGSAPNYPSNIKPFIKVIHSNGQDIIQNGINFICIGIDGTSSGTPDQSNIELIIGFNLGSQVVSNATVRLYDNNEGTGNNDSDYRDWTLDESFTQTTGPLNINSGYNIVKQVNIDTFNTNPTGNSVAISSLDSETFMGNVNVGEKLTVLNGIDISGDINIIESSGELDISGTVNLTTNMEIGNNLHVSNKLVVDGDTYLKDVSTNSIYVKPGSTVWTTDIRAESIQPRNYFNMNNEIKFQEANIKFTSNTNGGHIIDVSAITSDGDNLLLNGGLEFNNASDISNTIVNLNSIYPSGIIGSKILNIYGDLDMNNNDIINVNTIEANIIEASNQKIDISGNLDMNNNDILNTTKVETDNIETNNSSKLNILSDISMANTDIYLNNGDIKNVENMDVSYINIRGTNSNSSNIYGTGNGTLQWDASSLFIANLNDTIIRSSGVNKSSYVLGDSVYLSNGGQKSSVTSSNNYIGVLDNSGIDIVAKTGKDVFIKSGTGSKTTFFVGTTPVLNLNSTYNEDKVGHNYFRRTVQDISTIVIDNSGIPTGTEYVAKNIGSNVKDTDSKTQVVNCEIPTYWLENGWNVDPSSSYSKQLLMLGSQIKYDIYNNYLTGPVTVGDPIGAIKPTWDTQLPASPNYRYWDSTATSTPIGDIAIFTPFTYIAIASELIPARTTIQEKILRDGWITGFSLKWPWGSGGLGSILDISGTAKLIFYTTSVGKYNNGGTLSNMGDIDLYTFTSSNQSDLGNGLTISLNPRDWIYIEAETDLNNIFKIRLESGQSNLLAFSATNKVGIRYGAVDDSALNVAYSESSVRGSVYIWSPPNAYPSYKNY